MIWCRLQGSERDYDQKVLEDIFDCGDLVYMLKSTSKKGNTRKLDPSW
jgi:hypothetical protein